MNVVATEVIPPQSRKILVVTDIGLPELRAAVLSTSLDLPKMGSALAASSAAITVSGWVLKRNAHDEVRLVLRFDSTEIPVALSGKRADVVQRILKADPHTSPFLACGFKTQVQIEKPVDVLVEVNGVAYPWRRLEVHNLSLDLNAATNAWEEYCRNRLDGTPLDAVEAIANLDWPVRRALFIKAPQVVGSPETFERLAGFRREEFANLRRSIAQISSLDFCAQLVESAATFRECRVTSPFSDGMATCSESIHYRANFTALRFVDTSGEVFFVMQHVSSADAVYFPLRAAVIQIKHLALASVEELVQSITSEFGRYWNAALRAPKNTFGGVIASHGRPYHFYYDVAPAMELLAERGLAQALPAIVMSEGADFLSFKALYELEAEESVETLPKLRQRIDRRNVFFVHVGMLYSDAARPYVDRFDQKLRNTAQNLADHLTLTEVETARACFPLVWFGVTGQKRAWVEQVEGGTALLSELAKSFPGLGVVFDGWTAPMKPTAGDSIEKARDEAIINAIRARLPASVRTFSVVGSTTARKLSFAMAVDVFVANSATGSLHVSRFAQQRGVGHIGHQMIGHEAFIHYHLSQVDAGHVTDIPDPDHPRIDFTSYSIDWQVIYRMLCDVLRAPDFLAPRLEHAERVTDDPS